MGARAQVLYIEDEALVAENLCTKLVHHGYGAEYALSAEEGLELLAREPHYDLVLMDLDLGNGHMSGAEAGRRIGSEFGLPVVFYTGHADEDTVAPTWEVDAYGCVFKAEGDFQALRATIEQTLRRHRFKAKTAESYESLATLVEELDAFVCVVERDTRTVKFANDAAEEHFGPLVGRAFPEVFPSVTQQDCDSCRLAPFRQGTASPDLIDEDALLKDARSGRWYAVSARRVDWRGRPDACLVLALEVTAVVAERRRLLRETELSRLRIAEVNHRIKNTLTMVQSLVDFTAQELPAGYSMEELYHQIRALRVLHERLDELEATSVVQLGSYLSDVAHGVFSEAHVVPVRVELDVPPLHMGAKSASPLGLAVTELALNARKHAFSADRLNTFGVHVRPLPEREEVLIEVTNDGLPFPEGVNLDTLGSTGLKLVTALTRQLGGTIEVERGTQTRFRLSLPYTHLVDRTAGPEESPKHEPPESETPEWDDA
ncbi:MAG: response regulator [Spirochaetaceae bacterium]